jgi:hypothetical protein
MPSYSATTIDSPFPCHRIVNVYLVDIGGSFSLRCLPPPTFIW